LNEAVGLFSATKAGYQQLAPDATMRTGEWLGDCTALGINHDPQFKVVAAGHDGLHWIRRVFSDLEVWALGVPHGLRREHLAWHDVTSIGTLDPPRSGRRLRRRANALEIDLDDRLVVVAGYRLGVPVEVAAGRLRSTWRS